MPVTDSAAKKRLEPLVLVETAELTEEEWLSYRDVSAAVECFPAV